MQSPLSATSALAKKRKLHHASDTLDYEDKYNEHMLARKLEDLALNAHLRQPIVLPVNADARVEALSTARESRTDYRVEHEYGLTAIAIAVYQEGLRERHAVAINTPEAEFRLCAVFALLSIPGPLLRLLIHGNMCLAEKDPNGPLHEMYQLGSKWRTRASEKNAPGIYVVQRLRAYVSGSRKSYPGAVLLDNVKATTKSTLEAIENGYHRHLNGSVVRVIQILTFCQALEDCINRMPETDMDKPFPTTHKYVGYSLHISKRLQEHEQEDTSWFQHMVQDALRLSIDDEDYFHFESYAVCFLCKGEAPVAEVVIGAITESSIETGKGFGVYQGGVQTTSGLLGRLNESQKEVIWKGCRAWRMENTPYLKNEKTEIYVLQDPPPPDKDSLLARRQQELQELKDTNQKLRGELQNQLDRDDRFLASLDAFDNLDEGSDEDEEANALVSEALQMLRMSAEDSRRDSARLLDE